MPARRDPPPPPEDPGFAPVASRVEAGFIAYETHCLTCHGDMAVGIGNGPDLRRSAVPLDKATFDQVVRGGPLEERGMPKFAEFGDDKLESIRHYLRARAAELRGKSLQPTSIVPSKSTTIR